VRWGVNRAEGTVCAKDQRKEEAGFSSQCGWSVGEAGKEPHINGTY
jgi:hypothetical protein